MYVISLKLECKKCKTSKLGPWIYGLTEWETMSMMTPGKMVTIGLHGLEEKWTLCVQIKFTDCTAKNQGVTYFLKSGPLKLQMEKLDRYLWQSFLQTCIYHIFPNNPPPFDTLMNNNPPPLPSNPPGGGGLLESG